MKNVSSNIYFLEKVRSVKRIDVHNWIKTLILFALMIGMFSFPSVYSQETPDMSTGVNYEGPYDWSYSISDGEIEQDFQLFKENNVDSIIINLIWSAFQTGVNPPIYNELNINNVKRVLAKAEQYEIGVCMSFFQYWMDTITGVPSWSIDPQTGNQRYIAIVRDETTKGYFLEMIGYLVDEFRYSSAINSWSLLNEPMHSGSYSSSQLAIEREEFHVLIEQGSDVIRLRDNRPITIKFTLPYSPWHTRTGSDYSTFVDFDRVMQSLDFMSINTFADPQDFGSSVTWQGTTWDDFVQAVEDTKNAGYPFWVSEFGNNNRKTEVQRIYYESTIHIFQNLGVNRCFSWVWVHNSQDEKYNICKRRGIPKPAFFELNLESLPPPPPPSNEMTAEDWIVFWMWLKQNPPGWQKEDWNEPLEGQLQLWKTQTGTIDMTTQEWNVFWEWLKQNPPSSIKTTKRWSSTLDESLEKWKTEYW